MTAADFLSPTGFRLILKRMPNVEFMCQSIELPGISIGEIAVPNPNTYLKKPGGRVDFSDLTVEFKIDEEMKNYIEVYDWIIGLGYPENSSQYTAIKNQGVRTEGSIIILTSHNNPSKEFVFEELWPKNLSSIRFNTSETDVTYLTASVTFSFRNFTIK